MTLTDIVFLIGVACIVGLWCCVAYIVRHIDHVLQHERKVPPPVRDGRVELVAWGRAYAEHSDRRATEEDLGYVRWALRVTSAHPQRYPSPFYPRRLAHDIARTADFHEANGVN